MANYYVNGSTGNDTSGDGSEGAPWATITKAIATIATNAEHTVLVASGTYAESTGGAGYLSIIKNRTEWLTIQSASGNADDVVITGASHATYNILIGVGTTAKIRFRNATLTNNANTSQYIVSIHSNAVASDIEFDGCRFVLKIGGNTNTKIALLASPNDTKTAQRITLSDCTFATTGDMATGESVRGVSMTRTAAGATLDDIELSGCNITSPNVGVLLTGATNLDITANVIQAGTGIGLTCGADAGTTNQTCNGSVTGNTIKSTQSHSFLIGNGCNALVATNNRVVGGDYGAVIKNSVDVVFSGNLCYGPSSMTSAIYVKASNGTRVHGNVCMAVKSGGWVLQVGYDTTHSTKYQAITARGNLLLARNGCHIYRWGPAAEETGETSICNDNVLIQAGSGNYGTIKATSDIATLAACNTAWSSYDVTSNDNHSVDGDLAFYTALGLINHGMGIG